MRREDAEDRYPDVDMARLAERLERVARELHALHREGVAAFMENVNWEAVALRYAAAVEASGAEIVTVAVRRVNISDPKAPMLTDFIDPKKITYLPNTAGCFTAEDAIRTLRLAREAGGWDLVKLEVLGEARTLYPNMVETIRACEVLAKPDGSMSIGALAGKLAPVSLGIIGAILGLAIGASLLVA